MKNLFTAIQVQFNEALFDNSEYNKAFDRDGFRQHMLPANESSITCIEREFAGWLKTYGFKWEREFTEHKDGVVTMYLSGGRVPSAFKYWLESHQLLTNVTYGSVKEDASFHPSKARA